MKTSLLLVILGLTLTTTTLITPVQARYVTPDDGSGIEGGGGGPDPDLNRYIVILKNQAGRAAVEASASAVHLSLDEIDGMAVSLPPQAVQGLQNNPNIVSIESDPLRYSMHYDFPHADRGLRATPAAQEARRLAQDVPYGITMVQADQLAYNPANPRKVCIIDSGYDPSHEDLPTTDVQGYTPTDGSLPWNVDGFGHGSHVAGTIAAMDNTFGVVGLAPGVELFIVRVFGDDGLWAYASSLVHAAYQCRDNGANIISMSLGGSFKSGTEQTAFRTLYNENDILSVAAAGNGGNQRNSYPASYAEVVSVVAVDINKNVASFSQYNNQVELSAPGVGVRSTLPGGVEASVEVDGGAYPGTAMEYAATGNVEGELVDCGDGTLVCVGASGKVCLIERGTISFLEKVQSCELGGGVATVIYNNVAGGFSGTLGDGGTFNGPAVGISQEVGEVLLTKIGTTTRVKLEITNYEAWDGTSMATPHVSGVAALVWSYFPDCSNADIRNALAATAEDLGAAGRDTSYGFGLVRATAAKVYVDVNGCSDGGGGGGGGGGCQVDGSCTDSSECCSGRCKGPAGGKTCK